MNREQDRIALLQRHDFDAALHPRTLLGQDEFAAGEILAGRGQQNGRLQREREFAVKVLMQAIEVAGRVLQQQGRRPNLPGIMADF